MKTHSHSCSNNRKKVEKDLHRSVNRNFIIVNFLYTFLRSFQTKKKVDELYQYFYAKYQNEYE